MRRLTVFSLFLAVSLSLQACPNGWRQSAVDSTKCYLVVVNKKIWFEAGAYCANAAPNAFLTSITSAYETYALNGELALTNLFWWTKEVGHCTQGDIPYLTFL
jgi:hypothetical protein